MFSWMQQSDNKIWMDPDADITEVHFIFPLKVFRFLEWFNTIADFKVISIQIHSGLSSWNITFKHFTDFITNSLLLRELEFHSAFSPNLHRLFDSTVWKNIIIFLSFLSPLTINLSNSCLCWNVLHVWNECEKACILINVTKLMRQLYETYPPLPPHTPFIFPPNFHFPWCLWEILLGMQDFLFRNLHKCRIFFCYY